MASSSGRSSPVFDDDDEDYLQLMSTATPVTSPARKRTADAAGLDSDAPPYADALTLAVRANGNHLQTISAYAARKRLRPEQVAEVESFLSDPVPIQLAKLFVNIKATENNLAKFQAAKPKFEINSDLKTNLTRAVNATLCSTNLSQYKGEAAKSDVQTLLTRHRWGNFVAGTEHDKAAMDTVQKFIGDVFTQSRSTIKKEIAKSVEKPKSKNAAPSLRSDYATHTTIYQLTKTIVQKLSGGKAISIPITAALCARVALMRKWHVKMLIGISEPDNKGKGLWELVDQDLQSIRTKARKDTEDPTEIAKRVARVFTKILERDRERHGGNPKEEIPDVNSSTDASVISYQADVDDTIEARNRGIAVSAGGTAEEEEESGSGAGAGAGADADAEQAGG